MSQTKIHKAPRPTTGVKTKVARKKPSPPQASDLVAAVVEFSDDGIISLSLDGDIQSWNSAAARIFRGSRTEAVGKKLTAFLKPDLKREIQRLLALIKTGQHIERHELDYARNDGKTISLSLTISPTRHRPDGPPSGASMIVRDVTAQKKAEAKLRDSEAFYHSLVESLPQNILRKDLNERFTFVNRRFCEILKLPLNKIVGKTDFDFFPPDLAAKYQQDDRRVIQTGQPFETVEVNQPPGGKKLYVQVCKTPIRDAAGQIIGVQGIFWDTTEQKEAEIALKQSEERYKHLLGSVTDYIYTVELINGHPVTTRHGLGCVNVTGYTPEDYQRISNLWYVMIHEEDRAAVVEQANRVLKGQAKPLEHRIIHRDGSVRWVRNTQVPRFDETGRIAAYDGLVSDITERKLAEQKLMQANSELAESRQVLVNALADLKKSHEELKAAQMLLIRAEKLESVGRLAAGVAHEVKNPLAIIQSGIDYLAQTPATNDANAAMILTDMKDALTRADTVIRGLLDFAASQELGMAKDDLNAVIERPLSLLRHDLSRGQVNVVREFATDLPPIQVDRAKMEQVFVNLFINSLHAMPQGGTLTVRTFARELRPGEFNAKSGYRGADRFHAGDVVVVAEVDDTGTGIPPDKLSMLFEPFFTTKPTGKGTGLGLAVSRKIIEMHGGTIDIGNRPAGGVRVNIMINAERRT